MALVISCPECQTAYRGPEARGSRTMTCKKCGYRFRAADSESAELDEPAYAPRPAHSGIPPLLLILGGGGVLAVLVVIATLVGYLLARKPGARTTESSPVAANTTTATTGGPAKVPDTATAAKPADGAGLFDSSKPTERSAVAKAAPPPPEPPKSEGSAPPPDVKPKLPVAGAATLEMLAVKLPTGWKSNYVKFLQSWDFEKYTPNETGFDSNTVRVAPASDEPADVDAYAEKLKQKDYANIEYVFTEITGKEKLPDGFIVKGLVSNYKNPKVQPRLGLAMIRTIGGVRVHAVSTSLRIEAVRQEAIELLKSARLPGGAK
jgi:hypothetical protein